MLCHARKLFVKSSPMLLADNLPNGLQWPCSGQCSETAAYSKLMPVNDRGVRASGPICVEATTAVYETYMSWTYFQPFKVDIDKMPAPEPRHYQRRTKRAWDITTQEFVEILHRKASLVQMCVFVSMALFILFGPREKSFSGTMGPDGYYILLPRNHPEYFV